MGAAVTAARAAAVEVAPRVCCRCGEPSAPEQTPAAWRRPYACPHCLDALAACAHAPRWVDEALDEATADQGGAL